MSGERGRGREEMVTMVVVVLAEEERRGRQAYVTRIRDSPPRVSTDKKAGFQR